MSKQELKRGLTIPRFFTKPGIDVYSMFEYEKRTAQITSPDGTIHFKQENVEVPKHWSQLATNILASKYFHGRLGTPERETSVKQIVHRIAHTIKEWGVKGGYFLTEEDAETFYQELVFLLLDQRAAFNSPVWFNIGAKGEKQQASACFINSVEDDMESILELIKTEGMIFKHGSGSGVNLSNLRAAGEPLSTGGTASGPLSFMKGLDATAGAIKSGGKTRRAAKMVILNVDHPDIMEFIWAKAKEERKAHVLIDAGYDGSIDGEAYNSVFFQNANHSVRVPDAFMEAVEKDEDWWTYWRVSGEKARKYKAREILRAISEATWECGDPGLQFDDTTNKWNTCKASGRINASNPCSEFLFLDNTSCNLSSINLLKYRNEDGSLDVEGFKHTVDVMILAKEIIVGNAHYPTEKIKEMSHKFRPLGLGYANLGALLMSLGLPYDSEKGRALAATITAIMTAEAYYMSSKIAAEIGPFEEYPKNKESMLDVIAMHRDYAYKLSPEKAPEELVNHARELWDKALENGNRHGYRNSQVTLLAPTGTISFLMDCDTTGVEPDLALVKYKKLVGGGVMKIVNKTVPQALKVLGYTDTEIKRIIEYINENDTIEGAPNLKEEHLPVFDCAFKPQKGKRSIHYMGHVKMLGAIQPFLSGGISKTVNMPETATVEEIMETYMQAWKLGVKNIAIYRNNSKRIQPLATKQKQKQKQKQHEKQKAENPLITKQENKLLGSPELKVQAGKREKPSVRDIHPRPVRLRLPDERKSITHKFSVEGHEGYITVGLYDDGTPGEVFITMSKEGSTISGLMDTIATMFSLALQYGIPLHVLVRKFVNMRFDPYGYTSNPSIPTAKSLIDYIVRWLALKFLPEDQRYGIIDYEELRKNAGHAEQLINNPSNGESYVQKTIDDIAKESNQSKEELRSDSPPCPECGSLTVKSGTCYVCIECGATTGCS